MTRTVARVEPSVRAVCRWCVGLASNIDLTWQRYYHAASDQKAQMQITMCDGTADGLNLGLAINVARALGPAALRSAITQENLGWLCRLCHLRRTRFYRRVPR